MRAGPPGTWISLKSTRHSVRLRSSPSRTWITAGKVQPPRRRHSPGPPDRGIRSGLARHAAHELKGREPEKRRFHSAEAAARAKPSCCTGTDCLAGSRQTGATAGGSGSVPCRRRRARAGRRNGGAARRESLEEAARILGIRPSDIVKSLVVKHKDGLSCSPSSPATARSPGRNSAACWAQQLSLPAADVALEATGYERGTITPLGSTTAWPVYADEAIAGARISMGAGSTVTAPSWMQTP